MDEIREIDLPNGAALSWRVTGEGAVPLFFVHGYSMSMESWDRAIARLPARYRAYAYDLRGFGRSRRAEGYDLGHHVEDLGELLDALGLPKVAIIGHSLGGTIAQMFAVSQPDRIDAMVLSNVRPANIPAPDMKLGKVEERVASYASAEATRATLERRMPDYFTAANLQPGDVARFVDIALQADPAALKGTLISIYTAPVIPDEQYRKIAAPVLFVSGEDDEVTPFRNLAPALGALPHAETVTIPGAGHTPAWERPAEWSDAVYGFLERKL